MLLFRVSRCCIDCNSLSLRSICISWTIEESRELAKRKVPVKRQLRRKCELGNKSSIQ